MLEVGKTISHDGSVHGGAFFCEESSLIAYTSDQPKGSDTANNLASSLCWASSVMIHYNLQINPD